jgi:hypothetical protein
MNNLVYPVDLVKEYGAKAGILKYIANELPEIPQAKMIVKTVGESIDSALERAEKAGIGWPRIFRSSAKEELQGFEGAFPTKILKEKNYEKAAEIINEIENSPRGMKENYMTRDIPGYQNLPDKINVIIAEESPSNIVGTYIKHPNQDNFFIAGLTNVESVKKMEEDRLRYYPLRSMHFSKDGEVSHFPKFSMGNIYYGPNSVLEEIFSWHDRFVNLPELDENWAWQVEFGLEPTMFYQFRPLKINEKANFKLEKTNNYFPIGVTSEEGINVRLEKLTKFDRDRDNPGNCLFDRPQVGKWTKTFMPDLKANIFTEGLNFLMHEDIGAIRRAQVSAYIPFRETIRLKHKDMVNIKSDGQNVEIKKI